MRIEPDKLWTVVEERHEAAGILAEHPLRKAAVIAVLKNPFAGIYQADLSPMIEASAHLGELMAPMLLKSLDDDVQSYGKGGLVGLNGEQEHANALLTTTFAEPFRKAIGQAAAWISSMTKVASPGTLIDIPMNCKDDVYVRSHYDGMSLVLPGAPLPDEIAIIFCVANRGRLNARVGGKTYAAAQRARDSI